MSPIPETAPIVNISVSTTLFTLDNPEKGPQLSKIPDFSFKYRLTTLCFVFFNSNGGHSVKSEVMFIHLFPQVRIKYSLAPQAQGTLSI